MADIKPLLSERELAALHKREKEMQDKWNAPLPKVNIIDTPSAPAAVTVNIDPESTGITSRMASHGNGGTPRFKAPEGLLNAIDAAKDKRDRAVAARKEAVADAKVNLRKMEAAEKKRLINEGLKSAPIVDGTYPKLRPFIKNYKAARAGVEGAFDIDPLLVKAVRNRDNATGAYADAARDIYEALNGNEDLTPAESLFMHYADDPTFKPKKIETEEMAALRAEKDAAKAASKEATAAYKIPLSALRQAEAEFAREHKGRTLKIEESGSGDNKKFGLRVSGGGASVGYILKIVEQDGHKRLKGYRAIPRGTKTGDWLADHVEGGFDELDSIRDGYLADTPEQLKDALKRWGEAAVGNTKALDHVASWESPDEALEMQMRGEEPHSKSVKARMNKKRREFENSRYWGKTVQDAYLDDLKDLAERGKAVHVDFQNFAHRMHAAGNVSIDKNFNIYEPGKEPEGFEPIEFDTAMAKHKRQVERINEQGRQIMEKAKAGKKNFKLNPDGTAVQTTKPQNFKTVYQKGGRVLRINNDTGKVHQVSAPSAGQYDYSKPGEREKMRNEEKRQYKEMTGEELKDPEEYLVNDSDKKRPLQHVLHKKKSGDSVKIDPELAKALDVFNQFAGE